MAHGKKTGGRQKGTRNKATAAKAAEVQASGLTPLDYLLKVMRDENAEAHARQDAAKAAAAYVHPRLSAVQHSGEIVLPTVIRAPTPARTTQEWLQQRQGSKRAATT